MVFQSWEITCSRRASLNCRHRECPFCNTSSLVKYFFCTWLTCLFIPCYMAAYHNISRGLKSNATWHLSSSDETSKRHGGLMLLNKTHQLLMHCLLLWCRYRFTSEVQPALGLYLYDLYEFLPETYEYEQKQTGCWLQNSCLTLPRWACLDYAESLQCESTHSEGNLTSCRYDKPFSVTRLGGCS